MAKKQTGSRSFNAFSGVFVPTFLSIIGVILFLRLGYIVGVGGIIGSIAIILLAVSVTLSTGLALSSITTNIKIGSGGAYSIISKTLGLEIGGSVGIPLYLAQALSVALYIFGFAETFVFIFPGYELVDIALVAFFAVFGLTFISTKLAVRAQTIVFVVVCLALVSVVTGNLSFGSQAFSTPMYGAFELTSFWGLFALFFPAVTGLMAGVGMSGELSDPKKQIPKGVISGLGVTAVIYVLLVLWFGYFATPDQLVSNNLIIVELAAFKPLVLLGILAATFSSALTTLLAAPRVLQALSNNSILPFSDFLAKRSQDGEPRNALLATGCIIGVAILMGSLNSVAQFLTMFFLITYMMINVSVFVEQALGLASFRPTFRVPKFVPLYGAASSVIIMFLINPLAGLGAILFVFMTYTYLVHKQLKQNKGDIRSGLFREFSEWSTRKVLSLPESTEHIWKPNILLPVVTTRTLFGNFPLIKAISHPHGTMTVLGFKLTENVEDNPEKEEITKRQIEKELTQLPNLVDKFGDEGIFTNFSTVEVDDYVEGVVVSLEAIESQVYAPNILFLPFKPDKLSEKSLGKIISASKDNHVGNLIFDRDEELGLGSEEDIHVWISPKALEGDFYEDRYFDLALLIAYGIERNWGGNMTLWMCVDEEQKRKAKRYLKRLVYEARISSETSINVVEGNFLRELAKAPDGDVHVIPFEESDLDIVLDISDEKNKSFLFIRDSGKENILS